MRRSVGPEAVDKFRFSQFLRNLGQVGDGSPYDPFSMELQQCEQRMWTTVLELAPSIGDTGSCRCEQRQEAASVFKPVDGKQPKAVVMCSPTPTSASPVSVFDGPCS